MFDGGVHMRSNSVSSRIPSTRPIAYSSRRQLPTLSYRQLDETDGPGTQLAVTKDIAKGLSRKRFEAHCSTRLSAQNFPGFWMRAQPNLRNSKFCKRAFVVLTKSKDTPFIRHCSTPKSATCRNSSVLFRGLGEA
jgi:hypothetical protein